MGREAHKFLIVPVRLSNLPSMSPVLPSAHNKMRPKPELRMVDLNKPLVRATPTSSNPSWTNYQLQKLVESTPVPDSISAAATALRATSAATRFSDTFDTQSRPLAHPFQQIQMNNSPTNTTPDLIPRRLFHSSEEPTPLLPLQRSDLSRRVLVSPVKKELEINKITAHRVHFKKEDEYISDHIPISTRRGSTKTKSEPKPVKPNRRLSEVLKLQKSLETAAWTDSTIIAKQTEPIIISDDEDSTRRRSASEASTERERIVHKKRKTNTKATQKVTKRPKVKTVEVKKQIQKKEPKKSNHVVQAKMRTRSTPVDIQISSSTNEMPSDDNLPACLTPSKMQTRLQRAKDSDAESMTRTGLEPRGNASPTRTLMKNQHDTTSPRDMEGEKVQSSISRKKVVYINKDLDISAETSRKRRRGSSEGNLSIKEEDGYGLVHVGFTDTQWKSLRLAWKVEYELTTREAVDLRPSELLDFMKGPFGLGDMATDFIKPTANHVDKRKRLSQILRSSTKAKNIKGHHPTDKTNLTNNITTDSERTDSEAVV